MTEHETQLITVSNMDLEELRDLLIRHDIPLEKWGQGGAKTVAHLGHEIDLGEITLSVTESGQLLRTVTVAGIDVFHLDSTGKYRLRENHAYFKDGRKDPYRYRTIPTSLGEKIEPGETLPDAVKRALAEELGITGPATLSNWRNTLTHRTSNSYPGLPGLYVAREVDALISWADFRDEGYVEVQKDKDIVFDWVLVSPPQIY